MADTINLEDWFASPTVARAAAQTGFAETGDTLALLERVLELTEEPSPLDHVTESVRDLIAVVRDKDGMDRQGNSGPVYKLIWCLLDCGADPDHLVKQGFAEGSVRALAAKWRPWRAEAVKLAAEHRSSGDIREAVQVLAPEVTWQRIEGCLAIHGYDLPKPGRKPTAILEKVRALWAEGVSAGETIAQLGLSPSYVYSARHRFKESVT